MNSEERHPLENSLKKELEDSQWLKKFQQIGIDLRNVKAKVPLTQLCELKWVTENDGLVIHCPNIEVREALIKQIDRLARVDVSAKHLTISYPETPDFQVF